MKLTFNRNINRTMLFRIIISFVLIIILTLLSSSFFSYSYFSSSFKNEITDVNQKLLNQVTMFFDEFILRNLNELAFNLMMDKARYPEISLLFNDQTENELLLNVQRKLKGVVFSNRDIVDSVFIHSKSNNVIVAPTFFKHMDAVSMQESREFNWISDFYLGDKSLVWMETRNSAIYSDSIRTNGNVITVICSYPLSSTGDDVEGCIAVNLKEEAISTYLLKVNSTSFGQLMILDSKGVIISSSDRTLVNKNVGNEGFVKDIFTGRNTKGFTSIFKQTEYAVSFVKSKYNDWYYVSLVPTSIFYKRAFFIKNRIIYMSLIILMLVFFISNILSIKIYSPFRKIIDKHSSSAMKGIASGNLNEYGLLDSMFNNMFSRINDLQTMLERNSAMIRHNFLVELLNNRLKGDKFENLYKLSGINFSKLYFCIAFFTVDKSKNNSTSNENDQLLKYGMIDYIRCFDKEGITCYPVDISTTGITTIINSDTDNLTQIKEFIDQAEAFCLANFGVLIPVGVGNFVEALKEINLSYVSAIMSLQYKFIFSEKFTFYFDDISKIKDTGSITDYNLSERFEKCLKLMSLPEIESLLYEFARLARAELKSYRLVRKEASSLLNTFILYLNSMEVDIKEVLDASQLKRLTHPDNINCYAEAMISAARLTFDYFSNKKNCKNSELVDLVKKYVKNNLHKDISLNIAADVVHISPYYLSKIFKEETSVNYIDFITVCKIDKAKELLLTTNLSIEEITNKVGYNHVTYFTRKFKELTGKTPGLYRSENILKSKKQDYGSTYKDI